MATKNNKIWSFLILAVLMLSSSGATAQSAGCPNNMINGLSSCISYLRGNSSRPLPSCCTSLASLGQSQPECLCPILSNGATSSLGIAINRTLAMALPATCKLQTPTCDDVAANGAVANSPTVSPVTPPSDAASSPTSTDPTTTPPTSDFPSGFPNDASAVTTSIYLKFVTLLIMIVATLFQH